MARIGRPTNKAFFLQFEEFFRENYGPLSLYVARRVPRANVDDVVASSFMVAWKKFAAVERPSLPWLFRIASYEVSNQRRATRRHEGNVTLEVVGNMSRASTASDFDGSEVTAAFGRLSEGDQELLRLIHWDGLSRSEAAQVLDVTTNTVNVRHHRAVQRLSRFMTSATIFEINNDAIRNQNNPVTNKGVLP